MLSKTETIQFLLDYPAAFGKQVGFTKLTSLHDTWMKRMLDTGIEDSTLQAHRGSYKTTCLSIVIAILMVLRCPPTLCHKHKRHIIFCTDVRRGSHNQRQRHAANSITTQSYRQIQGSAKTGKAEPGAGTAFFISWKNHLPKIIIPILVGRDQDRKAWVSFSTAVAGRIVVNSQNNRDPF